MKKISLLILMLTFLLIPTCVNANAVSWEDFINRMEEATGDSNFESNIQNSSFYSNFVNDYNTCYGFSVWGDFAFASTSPTQADNTKLWFCFYKGSIALENGQIDFTGGKGDDPDYYLRTKSATWVYIFDISTKTLTKQSGSTATTLFHYYLSANNTFSLDRFLSESGADYFLDTSLVMAWNMSATVRYLPNASDSNSSYVTKVVDLSSIDDSNYPWEDGNSGGSGSGDTYYNYDFIGPNPQPYLKAFNTNGYMGDGSGDGIFGLYTYISDKKYSIDTLKLDLEVYDISESYQLKLVNTYKNYNGRLLNANGTYQTVSSGESLVVYTYNMVNAFGADFLSQYLDDVKNYAFTIKLYDINEDLLSKVDLLYFGVDNTLNYYPSLDDYYNPPYNNNGYGDINLNTDFSDLVDIFFSFMSTVMGFLSIFPLWMTTLIGMGITVAIILRIGGR